MPKYWCNYDLFIMMKNGFVAANADIISTTVSDDQTLRVFDDRSVPAASVLIYRPPEHTHIGYTTRFVMQSASEDGRPQPVATDVYTVTLTCVDGWQCGDQVYSAEA